MLTKEQQLEAVATQIAAQVHKMHEGRKSWSAQCGQWLVYGFERPLGFGGAVDLEARVERAWRAKGDVRQAALDVLKEVVKH